VSARLDRFSLTVDQYSGGITVMGVDLLYQPFRHLGFGLGYHSLQVNFQATSGDFVGKFNQDLQGLALYLTASF